MKCINKKELILPSIVIILIIFLCLYSVRIRNSVKIAPSTEYAVGEQVFLYRQDDEKWADDKLGDSSYSMAGSGCLVTCIASAVSTENEPVTPGELNALFSENDVFDLAGNIQWVKISEIEGYKVEVFDSPSNDYIEKCLNEGKYPIVRVRMGGVGNYHYVLIIGTDKNDYICMDPARDELTTLSHYGNKIYAIRCVWKED